MGNQCTQAPQENYREVNVTNWSTEHVYCWLSTVYHCELKSVAIIFKKHKINGDELISISNDHKRLQNMNIAIGDILYLEKALSALLHDRDHNISQTNTITQTEKITATINPPIMDDDDEEDEEEDDDEYNMNYNDYNEEESLLNDEDESIQTHSPTQELQIPKLQAFQHSLPSIHDLKQVVSNSASDDGNSAHDDDEAFVMLESPTHSLSNDDSSSDWNEDGCDWQIQDRSAFHTQLPTFPVGQRPGLVNMPSNKSTTLICRCINKKHDEHPLSMVMMEGYEDDEVIMNNNYFEDKEYTEEDSSYPEAIQHLTTKHTPTLFMLQTTKRYLLNGYLRNEGIHRLLHIPTGITDVVLSYFDDSSMNFDIKIADLFTKSDGYNKLEGTAFKFHLNMDHNIKLRPILTHKMRSNDMNDIELALECESLPIRIDKCKVLIRILCICHEIKYQKMDLYVFGTDLLGDHDDSNFNLFNKSGLKMIIPVRDIENLNELQFKINATILDIEYDPNFDNYGIVPTYNSSLKMKNDISYSWKLNTRILRTLYKDIFKQKFYSNHFDHEYWCLSIYKHEDGPLVLQLNLLRLQYDMESIDCQSVITLRNNRQSIWSAHNTHHMDLEYNNSFKWKLDEISTNKLFRISESKLISNCERYAANISIDIRIKINEMNEKRSNYDIYRYLAQEE